MIAVVYARIWHKTRRNYCLFAPGGRPTAANMARPRTHSRQMEPNEHASEACVVWPALGVPLAEILMLYRGKAACRQDFFPCPWSSRIRWKIAPGLDLRGATAAADPICSRHAHVRSVEKCHQSPQNHKLTAPKAQLENN